MTAEFPLHDSELALAVSRVAGHGALDSLPLTLPLSIMDAVEAREPFVRSRRR